LLPFVPAVIDLYRPFRPHLRWTMQCLVSFADRAGRCFPSIRKLAEHAGSTKSTVSRHLTELSRIGVITRQRRPGGVYEYEIDARFLPRAPVSHQRMEGVPCKPGQETEPPKQIERRFDLSGAIDGLPRQTEWGPRLRGWAKSRFWLPAWGPKPTEPGCFGPPALLRPGG
jgi:Helix-turn-helix domain